MPYTYYVYILSNKKHGTLYIGVTNNLLRRMWEHKNGLIDGFTKKYGLKTLVYYESTSDINSAISREKCLKFWKRAWKIRLIEESNLDWREIET